VGKLVAGKIPHLDAGYHYDGEGLRLQVRGAEKEHSNWSLQYTIHGRRREIGLGPLRDVGLEKARTSAAALRDKVRQGIDPLEERNKLRVANKAAASKAAPVTLIAAVRAYHKVNVEGELVCADGWLSSIERRLPPALLNSPIANVKAKDLLDAFQKIYKATPDTGARIRQRLSAVFDDAIIKEQVTGNPCTPIVKRLRKLNRDEEHHRALPYAEAPKLFKQIATHPGTSARALQFGMLTAARTDEILGMRWSEVKGGLWTVPAERMKMKEPHTVALSPQALAVLKEVRGLSKVYVFPSPERDAPLSNMAMLNLLDRMDVREQTTVHGLCRTTFSSWANDKGIARPDVIEACLAHKEGDKGRAAYSHQAKFTDERRALLEQWGKFLSKTR